MSLIPYLVIVVKIVANPNCRYGRYCHYFIMCHHVLMSLNPYPVIVVKIVANLNCRYGRYCRYSPYYHQLKSVIASQLFTSRSFRYEIRTRKFVIHYIQNQKLKGNGKIRSFRAQKQGQALKGG